MEGPGAGDILCFPPYTRCEERGPVLTAETHQAPEVCAVMLQKECGPGTCVKYWWLETEGQRSLLGLFYEKCDLLTEMIAAYVLS